MIASAPPSYMPAGIDSRVLNPKILASWLPGDVADYLVNQRLSPKSPRWNRKILSVLAASSALALAVPLAPLAMQGLDELGNLTGKLGTAYERITEAVADGARAKGEVPAKAPMKRATETPVPPPQSQPAPSLPAVADTSATPLPAGTGAVTLPAALAAPVPAPTPVATSHQVPVQAIEARVFAPPAQSAKGVAVSTSVADTQAPKQAPTQARAPKPIAASPARPASPERLVAAPARAPVVAQPMVPRNFVASAEVNPLLPARAGVRQEVVREFVPQQVKPSAQPVFVGREAKPLPAYQAPASQALPPNEVPNRAPILIK